MHFPDSGEKQRTTTGMPVHFVRRGTGYPVLFIHGIPTSNRLWTGVVDRIFGTFTCITIDLPGLGKTPKLPQNSKDLEALARWIEQIRITLEIPQWHVVGHDAGAAIAVFYAHLFQQHVGRLVLLAPAIFPWLKPPHVFRLLRIRVLGEICAPFVNLIVWKWGMPKAIEDRDANVESIVQDFAAPFSGVFGGWHLMWIVRWGKPQRVLGSVPDILRQLMVPTLIMHASRDTVITLDFSQEAAALIPHCRLVTLNSGHFMPVNVPELVAAELRVFFSEHAH
jgi:pimeloyl-ACP methyl ester carboxylesterase